MSQRTQKKTARRVRPDPPSRTRPAIPPKRRGPLPGDRRRSVPWWAVALVAIACGGILWLVLGQEDSPQPQASTPGSEVVTGPSGEPSVVETPDGEDAQTSSSVAAGFPRPSAGQRLQLRVLSLGDDPTRCRAESLRVGGEVRTAFHHRCEGRDPELAFFLIRLTGLDADPVTVALAGFELVTEDGRTLEPVELVDLNRRFPEEIALGPEVSRKGWVVFDDPGIPAGLRYVDADQALVVRFQGSWL